jgi:NADH-quinone oxidoreductase subunit N
MYPKLVYLYTIYDLIIGAFYNYQDLISNILMISGLLSITVGSIAAINQTNFKRFIAYSGISHTG